MSLLREALSSGAGVGDEATEERRRASNNGWNMRHSRVAEPTASIEDPEMARLCLEPLPSVATRPDGRPATIETDGKAEVAKTLPPESKGEPPEMPPTGSPAAPPPVARIPFLTREQASRRHTRERLAEFGLIALIAVAAGGSYLYSVDESLTDGARDLLDRTALPIAGLPLPPVDATAATEPPLGMPFTDGEGYDGQHLSTADPDGLGDPLRDAPSTVRPTEAVPESLSPTVERAASQSASLTPARLTGSPQEIRITKRTRSARIPTQLRDAYHAYREGRIAEAHRRYWQLLEEDPNNRHALLGLAAIATRTEPAQARALYRRLLRRNPRDPLALSGLFGLDNGGDPRTVESELKLLIAEYGNNAHLYHTLGNLYARQQRWGEAKAAFFRAVELNARESLHPERKNPDYAFNLAVALDRLGESTAAADYYRLALALSHQRPGRFDPAVTRKRLAALTRHGGGGKGR